MRTVITTASIAAALAVAMVRGVASAQDVSDLAYDIADAIHLDFFATQAFMSVADPDALTTDGNSPTVFADVDTSPAETSTFAYLLPERIPVQVSTLPPPVTPRPDLPAPTHAPAMTVAQAAPANTTTVSLGDLSEISAGAEQAPDILAVITSQTPTATVTGNNISAGGNLNIVNGSITFDAEALNRFAGIANIVVNSGNNNVLQGTLSVQVLSAAPNVVLP